jgi:hypothetical protein
MLFLQGENKTRLLDQNFFFALKYTHLLQLKAHKATKPQTSTMMISPRRILLTVLVLIANIGQSNAQQGFQDFFDHRGSVCQSLQSFLAKFNILIFCALTEGSTSPPAASPVSVPTPVAAPT